MAATPPHALEQRLAALVPRVRALRVARGASACLLAAVAATLFVLLLDSLIGLPVTARGLFLAVWVTALGVLVWQFVVRPWQSEISLSEVALELAPKFPELADRLHAIVDRDRDTPPAVRAALTEDALRRARAVDFARALPAHPAMLRACGAILALLGFLMLTGLVPGSADRLRRVAMPWARPPGANVRVVVTSGEPVVRRGGAVTLTAFAERTSSRGAPPAPDSAVALIRTAPGEPEQQLPMAADEGGVFQVTRPNVTGDFEYQVQIGGAASEWFRVTALDPVELADGTKFDLRAPEYTKKPRREFAQLVDFDAAEFTRFGAQLRFTQPAAAAHFEWRADGDPKPELLPVELAADNRSGVATLVLRASGELKLVLLRESDGKKLRTATTANVRVNPDKAPWFEQVTGVNPRPRTARPGARVPVSLVARDDASVSSAVLEYALDSFDSRTELLPIPLAGSGTPRASGALDFDPSALARGERRIRFRVRVADNRTDGELKLAPQEALYPPNGWSEITFSATAPPLGEQDIAHQRDAFRDGAEPARLLVRSAGELVAAVRADAPARGPLALHHTVQLTDARKKLREASAGLAGLARGSALVPEMRPLTDAVREVADRDLKAAEDATARAEGDEAARADALALAGKSLSEAGDKLAAAIARNAERARARLDRARLGALADDQAALAANAQLDANERAERQRELLARLKSLVAGSDVLLGAVEGAGGEEARRAAQNVAALSDTLRELDAASARTVADARAALVADLARDQDALAQRAAKLFVALETPARLAGINPPRHADFRRVTDLAAAGKTVEALTELEKQAQALDRLATEFESWAAERADPKRGAKHLALWQDDLLARFRAATKGTDFDRLPAGAQDGFRAEQGAIRAALAALHLPADAGGRAARDGAVIHSGKAGDFLANDGRGADSAMRLSAEALTRLAELTPLAGERLNKAARDFDKARADLDPLANAVELALRGPDGQPALGPAVTKRLALLVDRQKRLGAGVAALDLPGLTARQARAATAVALAAADLQDGSSFDVQASQLLVRREFERLKLALEGGVPLDVKAEELARKLDALADALDRHGPNLTAKVLESHVPVIQDALKQLPPAAPDAAVSLNDARAALQAVESGFRDGSTPDEVRRRVRAAADALARLGARLGGGESDWERVQRFAATRRLAAVRARELADAKAPFNAPASDEAVRQLNREFDELTHTRTGFAGQLNKRRVLDLYNRLRVKAEPDRLASDQRALAEALDELAAKMTDIAELATVTPPEPAPASEADAYLPSRPLAEQVRALVRQQRMLHDRLTGLPRALAERLRPDGAAPAGSSNAAVARQVASLTALAGRISAQADTTEGAAKARAVQDPTRAALTGGATALRGSANKLLEAAQKASAADHDAAAKLRTAATELLRTAGARISEAVPATPAPNPALGAALGAAERAMRAALDTPLAAKEAADALRAAAKEVK